MNPFKRVVGYFRNPRGLQPHAWALTRLLRPILMGMAKFKVFNVLVENREVIPKRGSAIVACNHLSLFDAFVVWGALRRNAVFMAAAELWKKPIIGLLMWLLGHIPVKRGDKMSGKLASAAGKRVLQFGGVFIIFPEGKCSKTGDLLPFFPGVAEIAQATGACVVPAGLIGTNGVKPLGSWRINRRFPVRLRFGTPIDPSGFTGPAATVDLLDEIREQVSILSKH